MPIFTYSDIVMVSHHAPMNYRRGSKGWIVDIIENRERFKLPTLPDGIVYTIEYEDGSSVDAHESYLELWHDDHV